MNRLPVLAVLSLLACNGGADRRPDRLDPTTGDDDDTPTVDTGSTDTGATDTGTAPNNEIPVVDAAVAVIRGGPEVMYMAGGWFAELTGDAHVDLLVGSAQRDRPATYLFEGPLTGDYTAADAFDVLPNGGLGRGSGDVNGDGIIDLGVMQSGVGVDDAFYLYFGPFDPARRRTGPDAALLPDITVQAYAGGFCDANGDGTDDVMVAYNRNIQFALGPVGPGFMGSEAVSVVFDEDGLGVIDPSKHVLCGHDLTGDGAHDLLLVDDYNDHEVWLLQDPPWSGWQEIVEIGEPMNIWNDGGAMEVVGDLTGDGLPDLFVAEGVQASLLEGPIAATSEPFAAFAWREHDAATAPVGDLDGDGHEDLVVGLRDYYPEGAILLFNGPVAAGTYDEADADLVLTEDPQSSPLGIHLSGGESSPLWGASSGAANGVDLDVGAVYVFEGWPSP